MSGCLRIIINGFTVRKTYRIMFDGFEGSVCDFSLEFLNGIVLPIELVSFSGRSTPQGNALEWITASEGDNAHFEIEASTDGTAFRAIGTHPSAGNWNTLLHYRALDRDPEQPWSYYRLKQVDFDGGWTRSQVIAIRNEFDAHQSPYPSPAQNKVIVPFTSHIRGTHRVAFVAVTGAALEQVIEVDEGTEHLRLDVPRELANGFYLPMITDGMDCVVHASKLTV